MFLCSKERQNGFCFPATFGHELRSMGLATLNGNEAKHEVKDETTFRHDHAEIWTQAVEICGQLRYQLHHRGAH